MGAETWRERPGIIADRPDACHAAWATLPPPSPPLFPPCPDSPVLPHSCDSSGAGCARPAGSGWALPPAFSCPTSCTSMARCAPVSTTSPGPRPRASTRARWTWPRVSAWTRTPCCSNSPPRATRRWRVRACPAPSCATAARAAAPASSSPVAPMPTSTGVWPRVTWRSASTTAASRPCATSTATRRWSACVWIRRASPRCTAPNRKSAACCPWRSCRRCCWPACRRWRTASSSTTTASR